MITVIFNDNRRNTCHEWVIVITYVSDDCMKDPHKKIAHTQVAHKKIAHTKVAHRDKCPHRKMPTMIIAHSEYSPQPFSISR